MLGVEFVAHSAVEGRRGHFQAKLFAQPLLQLPLAGESSRGRQTGLVWLEHVRRAGLLPSQCACLFVGQQDLEAPVTIAAEPGGHGIPMQGQMRRRLAAGGHLS